MPVVRSHEAGAPRGFNLISLRFDSLHSQGAEDMIEFFPYTRAYIHTYSITLVLYYSVTLLLYYCITVLLYYSITLF